MASITQGTTPTVTMTNDDEELDLRNLGTPLVSIVQGSTEVAVSTVTQTAHALSFTLTQAQTLSFNPGVAEVQVNWISSGVRTASLIEFVTILRNLHDEVIS